MKPKAIETNFDLAAYMYYHANKFAKKNKYSNGANFFLVAYIIIVNKFLSIPKNYCLELVDILLKTHFQCKGEMEYNEHFNNFWLSDPIYSLTRKIQIGLNLYPDIKSHLKIQTNLMEFMEKIKSLPRS
ncbi:hypothetical protein H8699_00490 [Christensenellaceae bacterium NSJ-44]|uniref:Uncharacterized protein n=1 Tax=Luoshenia tenuis TaxID=2763654 RepID=A0A926HKY4_9FIRM|nr:hypothetical protein [Luoshenia tenuis]MBC8527914.1 hypothetical protein [Luoshenia tenuis]